MSMQNYRPNEIDRQKSEVRHLARNGMLGVLGGVGGGVLLALLAGSWFWLVLGLVVAVAVGGYNYVQVRKIID